MPQKDCTNWEYEHHPAYATVAQICEDIVSELLAGNAARQATLDDSRDDHKRMFLAVAPDGRPYFAGNYRGSDFDGLRNYAVGFGGIPGMPPTSVSITMDLFHSDLKQATAELDTVYSTVKVQERKVFLVKLAKLAASTLVRFFTIHPYANGNGHTGRLMVWVLMSRYQVLSKSWTLHKSPPTYANLLDLHRAGVTKPLESFILQSMFL